MHGVGTFTAASDEAKSLTALIAAVIMFALQLAFPEIGIWWRVALAILCLVLGVGVAIFGVFPKFKPAIFVRVSAAIIWLLIMGNGIRGLIQQFQKPEENATVSLGDLAYVDIQLMDAIHRAPAQTRWSEQWC